MKLYANLLSFNRKKYTQRLVEQLAEFCDRIVVVDSLSTDGIYEWLEENKDKYKIDLYQNKWEGFGEQRQFALDKTPTGVWVLRIDNDELPAIGMKALLKESLDNYGVPQGGQSFGVYTPLYSLTDEKHYTPDAFSAEIRTWYNTGNLRWTKGAHEILQGDIPQGILHPSIAIVQLDRMDKKMIEEKKSYYKANNIPEKDYGEVSSKPLPWEVEYDL